MNHSLFQKIDFIGRSTLLGSINSGSSATTVKRIIYIASYRKRSFTQQFVSRRTVHPGNLPQTFANRRKLLAPLVQKTITQRRQQTDTCVVSSTAADTHDNATTPPLQRIGNHLAGSPCSREQRISFFLRNQRQTACSCHFQYSGRSIRSNSVCRFHRIHKRIMNTARYPLDGHIRANRLDCTFTSVGHRHYHHRTFGKHVDNPLPRRGCDLLRTRTSFERIKSQNYPFHHSRSKTFQS